MMRAAARASLQWLVRLVLGVFLFPVICCAFAVFSVVAACSDKHLLRPKRSRPQKWVGAGPDPAIAGASFSE